MLQTGNPQQDHTDTGFVPKPEEKVAKHNKEVDSV